MVLPNKINSIINSIVEVYNPEKVVVFGSYANGLVSTESDLDLLFIMNYNGPRKSVEREIKRYFYNIMIPVDICVYTPKEVEESLQRKFSFLSNIVRSGKIIYDKSNSG